MLVDLIDYYDRHSDAQHSDDWHNKRRRRIGGSEISTCLGINPHNNLINLIKEKAAEPSKSRYLNAAAAWGTLFESCIRTHCEDEYKTVIYETGAVQSLPGQATSPDGLSMVNVEIDGQIFQKIALWEFKSIYMRKIIHGDMPDYYRTQVWTGLETFPVCFLGIYVEANIRLAPLSTPGHSSFINFKNPYWGNRERPINPVICWGAISFVCHLGIEEVSSLAQDGVPGAAEMLNLLRFYSEPIDFGSCDIPIFNWLLNAYVNSNKYPFVSLNYIYQQHGDFDEMTELDIRSASFKHLNDSGGKYLLGMLRWKMIEKNEVVLEPKRGFLKTIYPQIQLINQTVAECIELNDEEKKMEKIKKTYELVNSMTNTIPELLEMKEKAKRGKPKVSPSFNLPLPLVDKK